MGTHEPMLKAQSSQPTFRSGAVARMAGMPVSTLRIWEQRYQAVAPVTAPTGHRLYSPADVERVVLLRRLSLLGNAIGSLAGLEVEELRELAHTQAAASALPGAQALRPGAPSRLVVVGRALARRLERPAVLSQWREAPEVVSVFDSLEDAAQAAVDPAGVPVDVLVWQASGLQADALPSLTAARKAWRAGKVAVAYRFAGAAARDALVNAGASVVHEPADDAALVAWLSSLGPVPSGFTQARGDTENAIPASPWSFDGSSAKAAPPRRFDDTALTEFAGMASSVACECPSHVAELLMQLSSFERYSAGCSSRSPADAELHAYLQRVAGAARTLFETALERVAAAEGLALPSAPTA